MRKFKIFFFTILSVVMVGLLGFEVYAATYLSLSVTGNVQYYATEIGARVWGAHAYHNASDDVDAYLSLSGAGTVTDNVYYIQGRESNYSNISASVGTTRFTKTTDTLTIYVFVKNVGDRYILPSVSVSLGDTAHLAQTVEYYYFDLSEGHADPLDVKTGKTASQYLSAISDEIDAGNYSTWGTNSSIDNTDVFLAKVTISLTGSLSGEGTLYIDSQFTVTVGFMADIQYTSNDILSIYQAQNITSTGWTKFGYNATLSASATKVSTNSLSTLYTYLSDADAYGNANITFGRDDYHDVVVYKDIDNVNIDILTGEVIGRLSDPNYNFEWFGRSVTLPAGYTLASGRTLASQQTFTVDVYTYYPTMYFRRWVVGNNQWVSVSNSSFAGAVCIPEYYTATFETTLYNPDKSVSTATYNGSTVILPRSYVYGTGVLTSGSNAHFVSHYGFGTATGYNGSTAQSNMMAWASNLTKVWGSSGLSSQYKSVSGAQGENYKAQLFNLLYLVKYANNNSQSVVGSGNVNTYSAYNGKTLPTYDGLSTRSGNGYYDAEKGGGTIGVYNSSSVGTATYDGTTHTWSASGYDPAGMNYGYNSTYTFGSDPQGLYSTQFLTYTTASSRYLLDGYVGSNGYTSVFCLGQANPWGNVYKWVFGEAVISDGTNLWAYVSYQDYDYTSSTSWLFSSGSGYENNHSVLTARDYYPLSYTLPTTANYYRYLGTSLTASNNGLDSLIGLPSSKSSTASTSTGLCDYYYCSNSTGSRFGVLRGGYVDYSAYAGAFYFHVDVTLVVTYANIGFRLSLIP